MCRLTSLLLTLIVGMTMSSCTSSKPTVAGVPSNLPPIGLYGSARTPNHGMARADYPFDENGNYVTSWAAEGEPPAPTRRSSRVRHYDDDDAPPKRKSSTSITKKKAPTKSTASTSKSKSTPIKKASSGGSVKHTVKSGDTLFSLARKYGSTVAKIKSANGMTSDVLRDGRVLTVPK
jgi:LysM domain